MNTGAFIQGISTTLRPSDIVRNRQQQEREAIRTKNEEEDRKIRRDEAAAAKARQDRIDAQRYEDRQLTADKTALEQKVSEDVAMIQMGGETGAERFRQINDEFFEKAKAKNPKIINPVKSVTSDPATNSYTIEDINGGKKTYTLAAAEDLVYRMAGLRNSGESRGRYAGMSTDSTMSNDAITAWEADNIPEDALKKMSTDDKDGTAIKMERARAMVRNGELPAVAYAKEGILDVVDEMAISSTIAKLKDRLAKEHEAARAPDSEDGTAISANERKTINDIIEEGKKFRTNIKDRRMGVPVVSGGEQTQQPPAGGTVTLRDPESGKTYTVKAVSAKKYLDAGYERVNN